MQRMSGKALDGFSPQQEPYRKLKAMLAELRGKPTAKGESARQIETIIANMERWRWYPRDLGSAHVLVNLPDFTLKVMHNGAQAWTTRIVIGKPSMATGPSYGGLQEIGMLTLIEEREAMGVRPYGRSPLPSSWRA